MIVLEEKDLEILKVPELYLFEGKKACFLLNGRTGTGIFVDHEIAGRVKKGDYPDNLLGKMISRGMIRTMRPAVHEIEVLPTFFLIDMTQGCNFNCCYCLRNPESEGLRLSREMLDRILDKITSYCRTNKVNRISIQPWGGEPLLELDKIMYIRQKMAEIAPGIDLNLSLETNGSLITKEVALKLKAAKVFVGISIDGPQFIHDGQRRDFSDSPTFDRVMAGVKALTESGMENVGTITVITKQSMAHVEEIMDFFADEMPQFSLKLNPMHSPGKKEAIPLEILADDMPELMERIVQKTISLWHDGKKVKEGNLVTALQNLFARRNRDLCHAEGCRGGRKMIIFDQKGNMFPCEMVDYPEERLGTVDDGRDIREDILACIDKNEYFKEKHISECDHCPWWYYCRGGCTSAVMYNKGCVEGVDECGCAGERALYEQTVQFMTDDPDLAYEMSGLSRYQKR